MVEKVTEIGKQADKERSVRKHHRQVSRAQTLNKSQRLTWAYQAHHGKNLKDAEKQAS